MKDTVRAKLYKVHKKLSLVFWAFVTMLLILLVLSFFFVDICRVTNALINHGIMQQQEQRENYVGRSLQGTLDKLDGLATGVMSNTMVSARHIYRNCDEYIKSGQFRYINFADKTGKVWKTDGTTAMIDTAPAFRTAMQGERDISSPIFDPVLQEYVVYFVVPVINDDGIQGALIGAKSAKDVELDVFGEYTKHSANVIVDENDILIFSSVEEKNKPYDRTIWDAMEQSDVSFAASEVNKMKREIHDKQEGKFQVKNTNYYISYSPIQGKEGWTLLCFMSNEEYVRYRHGVYVISFGSIIFAAFVIATFASYVIGRDKKKARELRKVELVDKLTGVGNRVAFHEELVDVFKQYDRTKFVILLMDIHNFKLINHNYSYQQGDKILCMVAKSLVEIVGKQEWVARRDSDCFSILIPVEQFDYQRMLDKILDDIRRNMGNGITSSVHFSAGYYVTNDENEDVRVMEEKAMIAWKYAKDKDVNCLAYDETILMEQIKVKQIEDNLQNALATSEFQVYLQPKVDLKKNCVCGAEALVRWLSKDMGFMAPDQFIPIVEANGFIREIDFYVFEQVCKELRNRIDHQKVVVPISVNQSRITILSEHYIERVKEIIEWYHIPVEYIDFEVTESLFVGAYKSIIHVLTQIHDLGISISMDDFGSGYSSLNLLKKMSIDNLKIDKEFLAETETSKQSRIIIKAMIDMARALGIHVICEGVELKEQVDFLHEIECDEAQGYYYDRPVSTREFYQKLSEGRYDNLQFDGKE